MSGSFYQPDDKQQGHGAHRGRDDWTRQASADADTQQSKQITSQHRADNAHNDIAQEAKAASTHDHARQQVARMKCNAIREIGVTNSRIPQGSIQATRYELSVKNPDTCQLA